MSTIEGTTGNDTLDGTAGADTIIADAGDDTIQAGQGGNDLIFGGTGNDSILARSTDNSGDTIFGGQGDGADTIFSSDGNDVIFAGGGNDFVSGNEGQDTIGGGSGNDTLVGSEDALVFGGTGNDDIRGVGRAFAGEGDDTIETDTFVTSTNEVGGGAGNDLITGGRGLDTIYGGSGDDIINGGDGRDLIFGGTGNDTINLGGTRPGFTDQDSDVFGVVANNGADLLRSFETGDRGADKVDVSAVGLSDFAAVDARLSNDASGNAVLNFGDGNTVTFDGVDEAALTADNFIF